jgi:predicted site-specific integrase-resolvase
MNLAAWAKRNGVARVTAYRWFRAGLLPVPARKVGRLILVDDPSVPAGPRSRTAVYARCPRLIRKRIWMVRWRG